MNPFPHLRRVRQNFPRPAPLDLPAVVAAEFEKLRPHLPPAASVAVGVGSRGISHLPQIVRAACTSLQAAGARPFIIPAMGSHGGATPEGQREVLARYGITEEAMGVPIRASLEVRSVGVSADGAPAYCSVEALAADAILLINRIKPHTDFLSRTLGSGLLKMAVIGLGKKTGAATMHETASRLGHERAIRGIAEVLLREAPILGGFGIIENQYHEIARVVAVPCDAIVREEAALLAEAHALFPRLPFDEIDLLIIDRLGKDISGAGMDPNVTNRSVNGYSSLLARDDRPAPFIKRIFVRDLTPATHGNAIGIGFADATTTRLVRAVDFRATNTNALTALTPQGAKMPMAFDTDREAIARLLESLALPAGAGPRVVRIADTLSVATMEISEALWAEAARRPDLVAEGDFAPMTFADDGNLAP